MNGTKGASGTLSLVRWGLVALVCMLVLAMAPQTHDPTEHIKLLVLQGGVALLVIVLIVGSALTKTPLRQPKLFFPVLSAFIALNLIAALFSDYRGQSLNEFRTFAALFLLYGITTQVVTELRHFRFVLTGLCISVGAASLYGLSQKIGYDPFPWADKTSNLYLHLPSTFGNPNLAGHTLILVLISAIYLGSQKKMRWIVVPGCVMLLHLFFTSHRAGWLALAAALVVAGIIWATKRWGAQRDPVVVFGAGLTAIALLAVLSVIGISIVSQGSPVPLDSSTLLRYNGYQGGASMMLEDPLTGFGPGVYVIKNPEFWTEFEGEWFDRNVLMNRHAHNELIEVGIDAGLGGLLLYIGFLVLGGLTGLLLAFNGETGERRALGYFATCFFTAFFVDSLFGFNLRAPVSAATLFLVAGALDGILSARAPQAATLPRAAAWAGRLGVVGVAIILVVLEVRVYASEIHYQRARGYVLGKQVPAADAEFEKAAELVPWNWRIPRQQGMAYYNTGDYQTAMRHLDRSAGLNPNWMMTILPLANASLKVGTSPTVESDERESAVARALKHGRHALALNPSSRSGAEIVGRSAYTWAALGKGDEAWRLAQTSLERALETAVRDRGSFEGMLGRAELSLGNRESAQTHFAQAVAHDGTGYRHWDAMYDEAKSSGKRDVLDGVIDHFIKRADPAYSRSEGAAYYWFGRLQYEDRKAVQEAAAAFGEALKRVPESSRIWGDYARFAIDERCTDTFESDARRTIEAYPDAVPPAARTLANFWSDDANIRAVALSQLRDVVSNTPPGPNVRQEIGWAADYMFDVLQASGNRSEELGGYFFALGQIFVQMRDHDLGLKVLLAASGMLEGDEKLSCAHMVAQTALTLGRANDARPLLESIALNDPTNTEMNLWLARCYGQLKKNDLAAKSYAVVLRSTRLTKDQRALVKQESAPFLQ